MDPFYKKGQEKKKPFLLPYDLFVLAHVLFLSMTLQFCNSVLL